MRLHNRPPNWNQRFLGISRVIRLLFLTQVAWRTWRSDGTTSRLIKINLRLIKAWRRQSFLGFLCSSESVRLDIGSQADVTLGVSVIILCVSILSNLQFIDFKLHLPILINKFLNLSHRNWSFLQFLILLLKWHQFCMNIIRTHAFSFQIQQLLQVRDLK